MRINRSLRKTFTAGALALLASQPVLADSSRSATVGVGGGALVGALAGGPVGLIIGAALGGHYGSTLETSRRVPGLNDALSDSNETVARRSRQIDTLRDELDRRAGELTAMSDDLYTLEQQRAALMGLRLDLLYTTDSAELNDDAVRQVALLAAVLGQMPKTTIVLEGHADGRGAQAYNAGLALRRAEAVRDALVASGVSAARIDVRSLGEMGSRAPEGDLDAYALERRVSVTLGVGARGDKPAVASSR